MSQTIEAAERSHKKFWWAGAVGAVGAYVMTDASESVRGGLGFLVWIIFDIYGRLEVAEARTRVYRDQLKERLESIETNSRREL